MVVHLVHAVHYIRLYVHPHNYEEKGPKRAVIKFFTGSTECDKSFSL